MINIKIIITTLLLLIDTYSLFGQKPTEDPNVMWTYGNTSFSTYPVVHPNGNVLIGDKNKGDVIELNGLTGVLVRRIPFNPTDDIVISKDGTRLLISHKVIDYQTLEIINENVPYGLYSQFLNPRNDMLVMKMSMGIVTFNLNDNKTTEYSIPTNMNSTTAMKVSNDGGFIALAQRDFEDIYHTHFYLYDVKTMQLIKELEDVTAEGRTIEFIQFSENAKYVGYGHLSGTYKSTYFSCEPPYQKKEFPIEYFPPQGMKHIGFIMDLYAFLTSGSTEDYSIIWDITQKKEIFRTFKYGSPYPVFNLSYNSILVGGNGLVALDLNKILNSVSVDEPNEAKATFTTEYRKGILSIIGYESTSDGINISINDMQGNVVFTKTIQQVIGNKRIEVPILQPSGVYILQIQDGGKNFSQKFLVME